MWCKKCKRETHNEKCESCGNIATQDIPVEVFWCNECKIPIIKEITSPNKNNCNLCGSDITYLCADIRPVFPEERLLLEVIIDKPFAYQDKSVWASKNRYYIDGTVKSISNDVYKKQCPGKVKDALEKYIPQNSYKDFDKTIEKFIKGNQDRLNFIENESFSFIQNASKNYPRENIIISFSGGKDSTVTADLVKRALSDPSLVHIFGDTTLEFPFTIDYVERFKKNNPKAIFKVARNKEQDFYKICEDIGPPSRNSRWCCYMFKTGIISRILNRLYYNKDKLTFIGIRKSESINRSKYTRSENRTELTKFKNQEMAYPVFEWKNIDVWLYILSRKLDFNEAYRLGYDRVGCWCCPNNTIERTHFITRIYMPKQSRTWRNLLISFAKKIGASNIEEYVDTGKWKSRCGGSGNTASEDIKIKFINCTVEENAKIYHLNKSINDSFIELFIPFGKLAPELGRKIINETIILDSNSNVPILSIQPFAQDGYEYAVKVKTINAANPDKLQKMVGYQIRKFNACRKCLKCESLCKFGAISTRDGIYHICKNKCTHCKMCVTSKYIEGGCLMKRYLHTKNT